jgi:hypothetical protein
VVTDLKDQGGKTYQGVKQQFVKLGARAAIRLPSRPASRPATKS